MSFALLSVIIASVTLNAGAQLALRQAMLIVGPNPGIRGYGDVLTILSTNGYLWLGLFAFMGSVLLWLVVLARVPVSVAYPMSSLGYIVAAVLAAVILREQIGLLKIAGLLTICLGVTIVAMSDA